MASVPTTFIASILKSVIGEHFWGTDIPDNFEKIAAFFGRTGDQTLLQLNNGDAAIEGEFYGQPYYNTETIANGGQWLAVCSLPGVAGTGEWLYASDWLVSWAALNLSFNWVKGQSTTWHVEEGYGPDTYYPDVDAANYHWIDAVGNVSIGQPSVTGDEVAALLVLGFHQNADPAATLTWDTDYFKMSGGIELPVTETQYEADLFSCIRAPNGMWMVSPAFKFDIGALT
jgi:hypothetical protein